MNISRINLNLLVAFDALLEKKSVTEAGKKLFITQAAMSNILKQLRVLFHDPLLIQQGKMMVPTRFAESLHPIVNAWLIQANHIFNPPVFDPATSTRRFMIAMDEFTNFLLLPTLYNYIEMHAPYIELCVRHILPSNEKIILKSHDVDLSIFSLYNDKELRNVSYEILFREKIVCLARKGHPLFKSALTLKKYLVAKHITLLSKNQTIVPLVDYVLQNLGCQRKIALRTTNIVSTLYTILNSHLVATIPESLAKEAAHLFKAEIRPCPFVIPEVTFVQVWHAVTELDRGCQWLRKTVKALSAQIQIKKGK